MVEWSAKLLTTGGLKLRDCERAAKLARRCLWTGYVPPTNQAKLSDTFTGKVRKGLVGVCRVCVGVVLQGLRRQARRLASGGSVRPGQARPASLGLRWGSARL